MGNKNIFIYAHFIKTWIVSNMGKKQEKEISKRLLKLYKFIFMQTL
jgi:hypothetical protein